MTKTLFLDLWKFVKNPRDKQLQYDFGEKWKIIFILLGLEFFIWLFLVIPLDYILDFFIHKRSKLDYYDTLLIRFVSAIIFAPILEELLFRSWLKKRNFISQNIWDKIFPYLVYGSSVVFGLIHISNYENNDWAFYFLSPLVVMSQMTGGFILAFLRTRFSLRWSMIYHSLWNAIAMILMLSFEYFQSPYIDQNEKYTLSICEKYFYNPDQKQVLKIDSSQGKIYKMEVEQYSFQHLLDTLYQKDKYYIDDVFIKLNLESKKGIDQQELLEILKKEYKISND